MMKKTLTVLVLLLAISSVGVASGDYSVLGKQVEIRQAHLTWIATMLEVSMEATIGYIDEISEGTGTSELSSLLGDFRDQIKKTEELTTHVALDDAIIQLTQIIGDFRSETLKQMNEHDGDGLQLLDRIITALDDNKDELDNLEDEYWETRKNNALEVFDIYVDSAQDILDILEDEGYDIIEAQKKLNEIKNKRGDLGEALGDRDNIEISWIYLKIVDLSLELGWIVRDLQVEIPPETMIKYWIDVCERVVERTDTLISELDSLGIDVTELESIQSKVEADLKEAQDAFNAGDLEAAVDALEDLETDLIELKDAYSEPLFGETLTEYVEAEIEAAMEDAITAAMEDAMKAMIDELIDMVELMEESIGKWKQKK